MSLDHGHRVDTAPEIESDSALAGQRVQSQDVSRAERIYGSFWINGTEFALPVSVVREVVNRPDVISEVPLAPKFMIGLFNLRGAIIPIVDLRLLLDFPASEDGAKSKIAIIENGDLCIGLLFDKTGDVLNENAATRVDFDSKSGGMKDIIIDGVLKFDNGGRMVQVLDPFELLRLEKVPRSSVATDERKPKSDIGKRFNCISFQLGHTACAIDLRFVHEVREMPPLDKSLLAHGNILGTANLRGQTIPIIDFRSFVGNEPAFRPNEDALKKRRLLVMKSKGGLVGLMVFSIDSIISYFESDILAFAKLALPRSDIVTGCLIHEQEQIVMLLDHDRLMSDASLVEAARNCQDVHQGSAVEDEQTKAKGVQARRTFILFSFEKQFALDSADVCEVINRPSNLLEPPYKLHFVEGIINLRSELITLINPRKLYGLPEHSAEDQKAIIFMHGKQKYAFLVDSIDEIVMTTQDRIAALRPMDHRDAARNVSEDVAGCVHVRPGAGEVSSVMILDVDALVRRCVRIPDDATHHNEDMQEVQQPASPGTAAPKLLDPKTFGPTPVAAVPGAAKSAEMAMQPSPVRNAQQQKPAEHADLSAQSSSPKDPSK